MILPKQQANAIATGRKTTHHTTWDTLTVGSCQNIGYRTPNDQAEIVARVKIIAVEERELRDLTKAELKREGCVGPIHFRRTWLEETHSGWRKLLRDSPEQCTDEAVERLWQRQTGRIVRVLTLQLVEEADQWMARSSGRLTKHQATSNPRDAIDELPLAPQAFVDAEATRIYETRRTSMAHAQRAAAAERFAQAEARARAAGIDTRKAARSVGQIAAALERRILGERAT
jgi:hypothetical protein